MRPNRKGRFFSAAFGILTALSWMPGAAGVPEDWKESPFLADRGGPKPAAGETGPVEEKFVLKGILWDPQAPSAIVNDRVVSAGDSLGRWQVTKIQKNQVTLSDGTTTQDLRAQ